MTTTAEHAKNIVDYATQADTLIAQLKPILDSIAAEEAALYRDAIAAGTPVTDSIAGRRRLAKYARDQVFKPQWSQTVAEHATNAWKEYLP